MSKDLPPSRTAEQFVVRFPDGMRDRIAESAKENKRSMNAEIVARLELSFAASQISESDALAARREHELSSAQLQSLRQLRQDAFFADAVNRLVESIKQKTPEAAEQLKGEIGHALFFAGMYPHIPEEALSVASSIDFQTDKRQALMKQLSLGHDGGEDMSYADMLAKTDLEIIKLKEQQQKIKLPKRPIP